MILGVDGKRAHMNLSGLGEYSRRVIRGLLEYGKDIKVRAVTPEIRLNFLRSDRYEIYTSRHLLERIYFRFFPPASFFDGMDIFHGLSAHMPLNIPRGVGKVVTVHDLIYRLYPQWFSPVDRLSYHWRTGYAVRNSDIVVAISRWTARTIEEIFSIDGERIKIIHPICSEVFFEARSLGRKPKGFVQEDYLLFVGNLEPRKNVHTLLRALAILGKRGVPIVTVGRGKKAYLEKLRRIADKGNVEWIHLGYRPMEEVLYLMAHARAFVYPAIVEGFGMPVVEAMAAGAPVITSRGSGLDDAAGDAAIQVDPDSEEEIAHAIERLLYDEELSQRLKEEGRLHALRFHPRSIVPQLLELYRKISE